MPTPIRVPRVNNNDDTVRLSAVLVEPGTKISPGDELAEIETDKASFTVEAENEGYVLQFNAELDETVDVGSVLCWLGDSPDESAPVEAPAPNGASSTDGPTLKALLLLSQFGLTAAEVASDGDRLTAEDVLRHVKEYGSRQRAAEDSRQSSAAQPSAPGLFEELTPKMRGMLRMVSWHRDEAAPAYLEIEYDPTPWQEFAAAFQAEHKLLLSPLLGLMSWRLGQTAAQRPRLNSTIAEGQIYRYSQVNLGFTVQSAETLYMAVVKDAGSLAPDVFVRRLTDLQRRAMANRLEEGEMTGGTVAFTSMARWNVSRHMPILPPYHSLIVAHSAPGEGGAKLGATYDHRLLRGSEVASALMETARPPND